VEEFENDNADMLAAIDLHPEDAALRGAVLALADVDEDDYDEYKELKAICEAEGGEFTSGTTCIKDEYFEEYAEELVQEIGDMPNGVPSYIVIDWVATAENIKQDYTNFTIGNDTYWYRR
jgi:hypothetical protein